MILLIIGLIVAAIGMAVCAVKTFVFDAGSRYEKRLTVRWVGVVILGVAALLVALDSFTVVPTRNLAMQTSFGKPTGTLGNGFHFVVPWSSIEEFDAAVQTLKLTGDKDDNGNPIKVRLANAATADVDVTVQWQIDPDADITPLYLDYRHFDRIESNVVRRQLSAALNATFEKYDPLASLKADKGKDAAPAATLADLAAAAKGALESTLPAGVKVRSLQIPKIIFDDVIQAKINQFLAALAETQIAQQQEKTAIAHKAANDALAGAANTPGVLYQNCLDMVERLTRDGKTLPAAFTCGLPPTTVVPVK
jgi:regulator of protease activity HflC (stomatin/prohibitin superfamily)